MEPIVVNNMDKLSRKFKIIAFDWDGTAVINRRADAAEVSHSMEELLKLGVLMVIITGTNVGHLDRQFSSKINGSHKSNLFACTNRGSEVYGFSSMLQPSQPVLIYKRQATAQEEATLNQIAEAVRDEIYSRSKLEIKIVYDRLNRRKIDIIPEDEWADPPKSDIGQLLEATEKRLIDGGIKGGIREVFYLTLDMARSYGLTDAKITSDVKHIEIGLTDKADSVDWIMRDLAPKHNIPVENILFVGDEFGPVAGFEGSDFKMVTHSSFGAVYASVGPEPNGVPAGVLHLGGGPARFIELLNQQINMHRKQAATG
jgi:hypothetical protein